MIFQQQLLSGEKRQGVSIYLLGEEKLFIFLDIACTASQQSPVWLGTAVTEQ